MSIGPMSALPASAAGVPLSQTKGAETERGLQQAATAERQSHAEKKAEAASGIGQTEGDQETSDRDADGRRLWEDPLDVTQAAQEEAPAEETPRSKDATGEAGNQLDLFG